MINPSLRAATKGEIGELCREIAKADVRLISWDEQQVSFVGVDLQLRSDRHAEIQADQKDLQCPNTCGAVCITSAYYSLNISYHYPTYKHFNGKGIFSCVRNLDI